MEHYLSDSAWRTVRDPAAARVLADIAQLRYLTPFLRGAVTVGEAAAGLGIKNDDLYYRVKRMHDLGILEIVRERPRSGKSLKYYSVAARGLFVPFTATPADTLEALLSGTDSALQRRLVDGIIGGFRQVMDDPEGWGLRIYVDDDGNSHFDFGPEGAPLEWDLRAFLRGHDVPALVAVWTEIALAHEDAKELQQRLLDLQEEFTQRSAERDRGAPARRHLLRVALAPTGA